MSGEPEPEPEIWSFPINQDEFGNDDRISFSRVDNKYIAVQEDGTEYEFDADLKRWIPTLDEDLIEQQQQGGYGYALRDDGDDERDQGPAQGSRKRKKDQSDEREDRPQGAKRHGGARQQQPRQNTAVYVTGLPLDATVEEVHDLFSRKCGVIAEEIDSGRPRIKLYTDAAGNFKGDALIVFFKPQSVQMAVMLLDDSDFRFTPSGTTTGKIRVQAADMSYKKTNYDNNTNNTSNADDRPGDPPDSRQGKDEDRKTPSSGNNGSRNDRDKQKILKKTQKLNAKLADWDDDEPSLMAQNGKGNKWRKVVILRHMFTLQELDEDPAAMLDIKEDIREECAKLGPVTNVVLFDLEEDGIASVKFKTTEAAEACVDLMDGRAFDGRKVQASIATGKERYKKSGRGGNEDHPEGDD